jgi:hypothetical protein
MNVINHLSGKNNISLDVNARLMKNSPALSFQLNPQLPKKVYQLLIFNQWESFQSFFLQTRLAEEKAKEFPVGCVCEARKRIYWKCHAHLGLEASISAHDIFIFQCARVEIVYERRIAL